MISKFITKEIFANERKKIFQPGSKTKLLDFKSGLDNLFLQLYALKSNHYKLLTKVVKIIVLEIK